MPCINGNSRILLYIKFTYRGIERETIYDPRLNGKLRIPDDVM